MKDIDLNEYDYDLPAERIAQYPADERDMSRLLIYIKNKISNDIFRNIDQYIPVDSLLVFNNTRVIKARILFYKDTGAIIEILCLEPLSPSKYELSFNSKVPVEWKCVIGNLKKWKGRIISTPFLYKGKQFILAAERVQHEGEAWRIRFNWNCHDISFSEVIVSIGHVPLPPYINREDKEEDSGRYQTVYSKIDGSVAAPTAGLHFTNRVFESLYQKGIKSVELTLHVGAGTFQPVKSNIFDHPMHREHFFVKAKSIRLIIENHGKIIPVGTTSVRTLESLYWLGVKLIHYPDCCKKELTLGQWEPYEIETKVSVNDSMAALMNLLKERNQDYLHASTSIIIIPGYDFKMINGMITNFHQQRSTLLLLISAWIGNDWKKVYGFALENGFRFLSYGDSSLLLK